MLPSGEVVDAEEAALPPVLGIGKEEEAVAGGHQLRVPLAITKRCDVLELELRVGGGQAVEREYVISTDDVFVAAVMVAGSDKEGGLSGVVGEEEAAGGGGATLITSDGAAAEVGFGGAGER